ncbi:MAG: aldehyde ferredoxin oxidoreductase family protein [Thermodesulfobacteriota bacterium]
MAGWADKMIIVDLGSVKIDIEPLGQDLKLAFLGGRGINSRLLYKEARAGIDPLGPQNPLIFGTGALTGVVAPAPRFTVSAKSPLTGIHGDASCGGHFSAELKWAGYDHILFKGASAKPVYLWIHDDQVELRDASHLWGKTVLQTEGMIKDELKNPEIQFAVIGPAGENLVKMSCVIGSNYRAAARTGMGAVMGSKKLKAVAVSGTKGVSLASPKEFLGLAKDVFGKIRKSPTYERLSVYGTPGLTDLLDQRGYTSVRNFEKSGGFEDIDKIGPEALLPYFSKSKACTGCNIHCGHFYEVKEGPFAGVVGGGPEYGAVGPLGSHCGISYAPALFKINNLCNDYGVDVLGFAAALGFAMGWYQNGTITLDDTDGIPLEWGNHGAVIELFEKMVKREGFGGIFGEGPVRASKIIGRGADKTITHSKGLDWGHADFRAFKGYALTFATSTRGGEPLRGIPGYELFGMSREEAEKRFGVPDAGSPTSYNKAKVTVHYQNLSTLADALEICKFSTDMICPGAINMDDMANLLLAVTGIEFDKEALVEAAERIYAVERAFLVREGIRRKDDAVVGRLGSEPIKSGPFKGERIDPQKFSQLLDEYYDLRGWDRETGIPAGKKLEELGLKDIAEELESLA